MNTNAVKTTLGVAVTNAYESYQKTCNQEKQSKEKRTSEEDTPTHQDLLDYMVIQMIPPRNILTHILPTDIHIFPLSHKAILH